MGKELEHKQETSGKDSTFHSCVVEDAVDGAGKE
jgi:hypothetical protein